MDSFKSRAQPVELPRSSYGTGLNNIIPSDETTKMCIQIQNYIMLIARIPTLNEYFYVFSVGGCLDINQDVYYTLLIVAIQTNTRFINPKLIIHQLGQLQKVVPINNHLQIFIRDKNLFFITFYVVPTYSENINILLQYTHIIL